MRGYANQPHFELLVDAIPRLSDLVYSAKTLYDTRGNVAGTLYYGELHGYVHFLYHDPHDETGFCGRHFECNVKHDDGSMEARIVRGPWSSRSSVLNKHGFGPCVESSLTVDPDAFKRGFTFLAGAITTDLAREAAKMCGVTLEQRVDESGEVWYEIPKSQMPKEDE